MRQSVSAPISATRDALGRLFLGRCFYLFVTLLVLVALAPFVEAQRWGLAVRYIVSALVMLAGMFADWNGNYRVGFTVLAAMAGVGSLFFYFAKPPRPA